MSYRLPRRWAWVFSLIALASLTHSHARAQQPPTGSDSFEERLKRLEEMNARLLEQNERLQERESARQREADERYHMLEQQYQQLLQRLETAAPSPLPSSLPPAPAPPGPAIDNLEPYERVFAGSEILRGGDEPQPTSIGLMAPDTEEADIPLRTKLGDGFEFTSADDEYELRIRVLDQTDGKVFVPNNQKPARSGLYIPRVRVYFEGNLTRLFEYEISLQRSVEGVWDLLDGNLNIPFSEGLQLRFGRTLVPYSYAWYDHLEQYFITPERALYPLNFGLSRSAGIELHGQPLDGRLQYAVGMFDGHLVGLADENSVRDAVGYLNFRPFLQTERFPALRHLNLGMSGFVGQQIQAQRPLPLRTSIQSSENDEAANAASTVFLEFEDDVFGFGNRVAGAVHLAWYWRGLSLESELQASEYQMLKAGRPGRPTLPVTGGHVTLGYFLTGEHVQGRGPLSPLRPFDPLHGQWGPGAFELFGRYSQLNLSESVYTQDLVNPDEWARQNFMTDIGVNWYLNKFIKFYFTWQHSNFGSPVLLNPRTDLYSRHADLFWIRCQIYF